MNQQADRRCPTCGALASAEAEWCGQCYAPFSPSSSARAEERQPAAVRSATPAGESVAPSNGVTPLHAPEGSPAWPCAVCGNRNPIELEACVSCGAPFGRGYDEPDARPVVSPGSAVLWSLVFPGLGHRLSGRGIEGLARAVLFAWTVGTVILLLMSRSGKGGLGPAGPVLLLFALASIALYAFSAIDARRLASGEDPLLSSRALLWGSVAVVLISIALAAIATINAPRAR